MTPKAFCQLAGRLLQHPTAPYYEHGVRAEVEQICAEHQLDCERDQFGNVLVSLRTAPKLRPVAFAAHLDHPGFEIVRKVSDRSWLTQFRGGVPNNYFRPGTALLLMPGGHRAKLVKTADEGKRVYQV